MFKLFVLLAVVSKLIIFATNPVLTPGVFLGFLCTAVLKSDLS